LYMHLSFKTTMKINIELMLTILFSIYQFIYFLIYFIKHKQRLFGSQLKQKIHENIFVI
jgi:hypothetical protein